MRAPLISSLLFAFFLILSSIPAQSQYFRNVALAGLRATYTNHENYISSINFTDGSRMRVVLEHGSFACGFFCNGTCTSYLFAILVNPYYAYSDMYGNRSRPVIWSANRDNPVREGAKLNLTEAGGLVLQDVDGSIVWTSNTTNKSVPAMDLTAEGNLMLIDRNNSIVWQSFDHPTDCLVPGQKLYQGQKLIPSVSSTNWTAQKDMYSLQVAEKGLFAYVGSNPPQVYYYYLVYEKDTNKKSYLELVGGSLCFFFFAIDNPGYCGGVKIFAVFEFQYIKLMPDGHLKVFGWDGGWTMVADLLTTTNFGECSNYPLFCGRNAICSRDQQCTCPGKDSFRAVNDSEPNKGCFPITPLTCNATQHQHFIELKDITYATYVADMEDVDMETCKQECMKKCLCKAALFKYGSNSSSGNCFLPSELFTTTRVDAGLLPYNASAFIKVQNVKTKKYVARLVGSTIGSLALILTLGVGLTKFILKKQKTVNEIEEEYLDQVSGMPTRFSCEQLKTATQNFSKKLGEGGFGSVFQGTLEDGSQIAVKCLLQGLAHVRKSFLAEVESIGSIHHVNLVRLRGFCAWKSERLLVYEFMSNGSLDQWIYSGDRKHILGWECRKKIILDIAKGLAYLHEDCRQKIIHLDIKPQNILLDEDFNAKVSDFGLSKLIDRNQSRQEMSTLRGTPGYLAPEWLGSIITEKVDVYSFGIVLMEILCGRKNFDTSQPEESRHLLGVFQRCWENGTLLDIVDRFSEDMQVHGIEVMEMMKMAAWCLQSDFTRRPSMSSVVKALEGVINVESNLNYNFLYPKLQKISDEHLKISKPLLPSILSGPR